MLLVRAKKNLGVRDAVEVPVGSAMVLPIYLYCLIIKKNTPNPKKKMFELLVCIVIDIAVLRPIARAQVAEGPILLDGEVRLLRLRHHDQRVLADLGACADVFFSKIRKQ